MKNKERIYISGPMTGLEREEYMARFKTAEQHLRKEGYCNIVNPIKFFMNRWPWIYHIIGYSLTLIYDLWRLSRCDRIYMLPDWEESRGARVESFFAFNMPWRIDSSRHIRRLPDDVRERIDKKMVIFVSKAPEREQSRIADSSQIYCRSRKTFKDFSELKDEIDNLKQ